AVPRPERAARRERRALAPKRARRPQQVLQPKIQCSAAARSCGGLRQSQLLCGLRDGFRDVAGPDPIAERNEIGAGHSERRDLIRACGEADAWRLEYFSPPGDALLDRRKA